MKILVIRRDNIGDLVCTTPLIAALRQRYPEAHLAALVNSYNAPVLAGNPDLDAVYAYTKGKHREPGQSLPGVHWQRLKLLRHLRRERFDVAVLAAPGNQDRALALARQIRVGGIVGFREPGRPIPPGLDRAVEADPVDAPRHEVERVFRIGQAFEIGGAPPGLKLAPEGEALMQARARLAEQGWSETVRPIGVHLSARNQNRWPEQNFTGLIRRLWETHRQPFLLFWAPGAQNNRQHPGDDALAQRVLAELGSIPVLPFPTLHLRELIAGLSLCQQVICCDGGALHLAAALGKPLTCLYRQSQVARWHPWGVPYRLLQAPSQNVADIPLEAVEQSFAELQAGLSSELEGRASR